MAAATLYGAGSGGALGQYSRDGQNRAMKIQNESDLAAINLYIIPSVQDCCWSRDLLEVHSLKKGEWGVFNFDDGSDACHFDIRITSNRDVEWNLDWFDVCEPTRNADTIILKPQGSALLESSKNGKKAKNAKNETPNIDKGRPIRIVNESDQVVLTVSIIPAGKDCCWSPDLLGENVTIGARQTQFVNADDGSAECEYDVRIRSNFPGTDWNFDRINVCNWNVTLTLKGVPGPTEAKGGSKRKVTVKNDSQFKVTHIYVMPSSEHCCWSSNALRAPVLWEKQVGDIDFDGGSHCKFDIRVVGRSTDRFSNLPTRPDKEWNFDGVGVCRDDGKKTAIVLK